MAPGLRPCALLVGTVVTWPCRETEAMPAPTATAAIPVMVTKFPGTRPCVTWPAGSVIVTVAMPGCCSLLMTMFEMVVPTVNGAIAPIWT